MEFLSHSQARYEREQALARAAGLWRPPPVFFCAATRSHNMENQLPIGERIGKIRA